MPTLNVNSFLWDEDMVLNDDGIVDEDVEYAFSHGHCHSFAAALAERTGWDLVGVLWSQYVEGLPSHVCCQDEDGRLWDIHGIAYFDDAEPMDLKLVRGNYRPPQKRIARMYVEDWMSKHRAEIRN